MQIKDFVNKYDPQNQFSVLKNTYQQIEFAWMNEIDGIEKYKESKFDSVIVTGLGGSAISGDLMGNFLREEIPLPYSVNRNYKLPHYANENTLVIASSYSGNTEETLSATHNALEKGCKIICVTTGGKLEELAVKNNLPIAQLQKGYQPRYALAVNFFTLLKIMQYLKLASQHNTFVEDAKKLFKKSGEEYAENGNAAFQFAEKLTGYIPIIYSVDGYTSAVGNRLKGQFNENSKVHAFHNVFPEFNHNEIVGWETFKEKDLFGKVIYFDEVDYNERIKKRMNILKEIIQKAGAEVLVIGSEQKTYKLRLLDMVFFGDWVSYYLAVMRSKDPSEIDNIVYLKEKLAKS